MTELPTSTPRPPWWRWMQLVDRPSPLAKQLPTVGVLLLGILLAAVVPGIEFEPLIDALAGIGVVALATVLAVLFTVRRIWDGWTVMLIPMLDIIGLGLFRAGTGGVTSLFGGFILLPVVWLASAPERRVIAYTFILSSIALLLPFFRTPPTDWEQWLRGVVTPLVFAMVAAVVNELFRMQRQRAELAERLASERERALESNVEVLWQLRQSEQRYRELAATFRSVWDATTAQGVISTDLEGRVEAWNPGAATLFGRSSKDVVGELRIDALFPAEALALLADGAPPAVAGDPLPVGVRHMLMQAQDGEQIDRDLDLYGAHGALVPMRLTVTARRDTDETTLGYVLVATDETRAAEVMRMKDEFVGMISHELRTPLSSILGYLDLLTEDEAQPLTDEQRRFVAVIERNANRLLKLVRDLLFVAQVESGRFPLDFREADIVPVIEASIESARPIAEQSGVDLVAELPASAPAFRFDSERIGQAIDNLVSNAIKFTPRGGRVVVSLSVGSASVSVSVRDTGIGVPDDEMGRLFTRFFRASTATRNSVPGVGLGLTITKAIVVAHGGWMDVASQVGVGTDIKFSLPRQQTVAPDGSGPERSS